MTWRLLFGAGAMLFMFRELLHEIAGLGARGGGISCHFNWYARSIYFGRGEEGGQGGGNMIFRLKWIGGER
jgi:hypothetical protein